jgi:BCD family chlorophyll transporter-like MFS transporter
LIKAYMNLRGNRVAVIFFVFLAATNFFFVMQEYVLEPFGGVVLGFEVFRTTGFNLYWSFGVLAGMIAFASLAYLADWRDGRKVLRIGCTAGAFAFFLLGFSSSFRIDNVVTNAVLIMGLSKGVYNVGISYLTMNLVDERNSGFFMGLWNFISGLALALGGMAGGPLRDGVFALTGSSAVGYASVFVVEGLGLLACLYLLRKIDLRSYWKSHEIIHSEPVSA